VIRDILHRLADRFPSHVLVWPVLVQGEGAAAQVAAAVEGFSALPEHGPVPRPDLVIVARGGGSIEDLWAFNEEIVVRAIAASTIPVISAVGHETDTTLADFAADMRAPTPTAAAEMAVPVREDLRNQLADLALRKRRSVARPVATGRERLEARAQRLPRPDALLASVTQRLDDLADRLRRGLKDRAAIEREKLHAISRNLSLPLLRSQVGIAGERLDRCGLTPGLFWRRFERARDSFAPLDRAIPLLDPDKPLDRGFARVTDPDGQTLTSRELAAREKALVLHFRDGKLDVALGGGGQPARKSRSDASQSRQGDLF
jgi:exodeoxyribonuclease VII large subunit